MTKRISLTESSDRSRTCSTQLEQSSAGISNSFDETRRLARFRVFDTLSLKTDDVVRICLVNFLVDVEEQWKGSAVSRLWNGNIVTWLETRINPLGSAPDGIGMAHLGEDSEMKKNEQWREWVNRLRTLACSYEKRNQAMGSPRINPLYLRPCFFGTGTRKRGIDTALNKREMARLLSIFP